VKLITKSIPTHLLSILPPGVWSKNCTGASISLLSNVLCTWTAARNPPNAKENALTNVRAEFIMQNIQSTTCTVNSGILLQSNHKIYSMLFHKCRLKWGLSKRGSITIKNESNYQVKGNWVLYLTAPCRVNPKWQPQIISITRSLH